MKTIKINFQMTKITLKKVVMLLFFVAAFTTGAFAQNSCLVQGYTGIVNPPSPYDPALLTVAQIESCASGGNLKYAATPSVPSTFSWVLSVNTSGAAIVGASNLQYIEVSPGSSGGSFTLTCTVTKIASPFSVNTCAVSVAVYKPQLTGVPASRCGPGAITLGATGCDGVVNWFTASSGGSSIFTGSSLILPSVLATTSYWASCTITTPFQGFVCESPRVEVIATIKPVPSCNITGNNNVCPGSTNTYTSTTIPADGVSHSWTIVGAIINGPTTGPSVSVTAPSTCTSYTLTDNIIRDGCPSSCTQTFNVVDTTPPVFTFCPPGSNLGCNPSGVPAAGTAIATDACGTPTITSALGTVSVNGCLRSQTRTYTATDICLNTATCTQVFTWTVDITPPVFTFCPPGSDLGCNPTGVPAPGAATATDACGAPTITSALGTVSVNGCLRSQTRTYTATDGCL